jgi:hypothetical protein
MQISSEKSSNPFEFRSTADDDIDPSQFRHNIDSIDDRLPPSSDDATAGFCRQYNPGNDRNRYGIA